MLFLIVGMDGTLAIKRWLNLPPDSLVLRASAKESYCRKLHSHNHRSCCSYLKPTSPSALPVVGW